MRVGVGFPFWGDDPLRNHNYQHVYGKLLNLFDFAAVIPRTPLATNRGQARNMIVKEALDRQLDVIVLCDADTFPQPMGLHGAIWEAYTDGGLHFAFDYYYALNETGTHLVTRGQNEDALHHLQSSAPGSLGGVMAIRPNQWFEAGGSPEMDGWGFEDVMFAVQARTLIRPNTWHPGYITHLYHPTECAVGSPDYVRNISECKRVEALDNNRSGLLEHMKKNPIWRDWS